MSVRIVFHQNLKCLQHLRTIKILFAANKTVLSTYTTEYLKPFRCLRSKYYIEPSKNQW